MKHAACWLTSTIAVLIGVLVIVGYAVGDDDPEDWDDTRRGSEWRDMPRNVAPVTHAAYAAECGACHMAYPPGLLPGRSWERLMQELAEHFGDDASLPPDVEREIAVWLQANASDRVASRIGAKIGRSIGPGKAPLRISETRYFQRKHDEVPRAMAAENPQVRSLANCAACHDRAGDGVFDEHDVRIPGFEWVRF